MTEKSIIEKLKLNKYKDPIIINPLDDGLSKQLKARINVFEKTELMIIFVKDINEFVTYFEKAKNLILENGILAFAYAKKGNKLYDSYIPRDDIFPALKVDDDGYPKASLLKFNRMIKYDDNFTLVALKKTKRHEVHKKDGRIKDYEKYVPKLMEVMNEEIKNKFEKLTPGYQKDWARYVYSAKTELTRKKHIEEMISILQKGYKTRDMYKRGKK
ncbi:YdeI/OmpD-associated family protein [Companilactobacillus sp. DQM5]|uniref:YdeI/OmpD-associated family protein n=1 Tax=Companilactobacillus sp. DQM5 TaxID=3463359 RepID=UPI00405845C2